MGFVAAFARVSAKHKYINSYLRFPTGRGGRKDPMGRFRMPGPTRRTVDRKGADTDILTKGRHDPCVGIRAVPVGEAMMACVLADHFLRDRGQTGR